MAKNLLEAYKQKIAIADGYYAKLHDGERLDNTKRLTVARCLENTQNFLTEAMANSSGVQLGDLGQWKRFCLNLNTVVLPNLIINDLFLVSPMSSITGIVAYLDYCAASDKGDVKKGDVFNGVYGLGQMSEGRRNYTAQNVVETAAAAGEYSVSWTPVVKDTFGAGKDIKITHTDNTVGYTTVDAETGKIVGNVNIGDRIAYAYDNAFVPANDIPTLGVQMRTLALTAHARRIAVYYSNLAQFQAKNDYGFDMGAELATQAVSELQYEIDSEGIALLEKCAEKDDRLVFSKTQPIGVSMRDHFMAFLNTLEIGKQIIYDRTHKFSPNMMVIASDVLPVLSFIDGWKAASRSTLAGPYFAGTLGELRVYVSPTIAASKFILVCKGNDMSTAPCVYAPYLPIVPTQLLEFADGATSRGWATMYDMQPLSLYEVSVSGKVSEANKNRTGMAFKLSDPGHGNASAGDLYSPLLVAGVIVA